MRVSDGRSQSAPVAEKKPKAVRFGKPEGYEKCVQRPLDPVREHLDPYAWLRCDDRKDPQVLEHLRRENEYAEQMTQDLQEFRQTLYREMLGHVQETDDTCPHPHGPYQYYVKTLEGKSYEIHCRKPTCNQTQVKAEEQVLLDVNAMAEELEYCDVPGIDPSPCHEMYVYAIDTKGSEDYDLVVVNASTGEEMDRVPRTGGCFEWDEKSAFLFYTKRDKAQRQFQIWRHKLGSQEEDALLLQENDELFNLTLSKTLSGRFIVTNSSSNETSEERLLDLENEGAEGNLRLLQERKYGLLYSVTHRGDNLYIETNLGKQAQNFTLLVCSIEEAAMDRWEAIKGFEYDPSRYITDAVCFEDHIAVFGRQDGFTKLWILKMDGSGRGVSSLHEVEFEEFPSTVSRGINREFKTDVIRVGYQSLVSPRSVIDYNMDKKTKETKKVKPVPNYNKTLYASERLVATARDGMSIPISIVYRKDKHVPGRPEHLMLYGYGSYGICNDPFFSPSNLVLLDRGVHFAIAHIRGGGEMGRAWYEDQGKYLAKKNTFYDFIDVADHLVVSNWTKPELMAIHGRSAGGLLVGAVLNMRPDICKVCLAGVPFVDLMCTMSDPSIPLTVPEWEEWGNPHDERYYDYMLSYSPIDNVSAQTYPAVMIAAGLHDPRVAYWEPAKWAAKLRELKTDSNPVILKTEMSSGHFSASDRYKYLREKAFEYAFVLDQLGLCQA